MDTNSVPVSPVETDTVAVVKKGFLSTTKAKIITLSVIAITILTAGIVTTGIIMNVRNDNKSSSNNDNNNNKVETTVKPSGVNFVTPTPVGYETKVVQIKLYVIWVPGYDTKSEIGVVDVTVPEEAELKDNMIYLNGNKLFEVYMPYEVLPSNDYSDFNEIGTGKLGKVIYRMQDLSGNIVYSDYYDTTSVFSADRPCTTSSPCSESSIGIKTLEEGTVVSAVCYDSNNVNYCDDMVFSLEVTTPLTEPVFPTPTTNVVEIKLYTIISPAGSMVKEEAGSVFVTIPKEAELKDNAIYYQGEKLFTVGLPYEGSWRDDFHSFEIIGTSTAGKQLYRMVDPNTGISYTDDYQTEPVMPTCSKSNPCSEGLMEIRSYSGENVSVAASCSIEKYVYLCDQMALSLIGK